MNVVTIPIDARTRAMNKLRGLYLQTLHDAGKLSRGIEIRRTYFLTSTRSLTVINGYRAT